MVVVRDAQSGDSSWSLEEALKAVISSGVIGATEIRSGSQE